MGLESPNDDTLESVACMAVVVVLCRGYSLQGLSLVVVVGGLVLTKSSQSCGISESSMQLQCRGGEG